MRFRDDKDWTARAVEHGADRAAEQRRRDATRATPAKHDQIGVHRSGHLHGGITGLSISHGRGDTFSLDTCSRHLFEPVYTGGLELLVDLFAGVGFALRRRVRHGCDVAVDRVAPDVEKGDVRIERFG